MLIAAALLVIGLIGLFVPVSTSDGNAGSLGCGSAISADYAAAHNANDHSVAGIPILNQVVPHTDFVAAVPVGTVRPTGLGDSVGGYRPIGDRRVDASL